MKRTCLLNGINLEEIRFEIRVELLLFIGNYLNESFLKNLISLNENIFYYFFIIITILLFLISLNFNIKYFLQITKKLNQFVFNRNTKNYTDKNEIINEYIPQDEIKNLIQEDLPFIKAENSQSLVKTKFQIPSIDLLKAASKKERDNVGKKESNDPVFLEKILLDFGVNGNIKKLATGLL